MNTKQILIVISAFLLGGILGFIINGQIHTARMQELMMSASERPFMPHGSGGNMRPHDGSGRGAFGKYNLPPFVQGVINDLELSPEQQNQIEGIVRKNRISRQDVQSMRIDKLQPVISEIKSVLSEEQKDKFDEVLRQHAMSALFK